ncbi:MAG: DUF362 domain-containing protein [Anaerolineales bacterium]|jgi:uncharacterized Fe-S center protein
MKKNISRRDFLHLLAMAGGATLVSCIPESETITPTSVPTATQLPKPTAALPTDIPQPTNTAIAQNITTVYMTTNISADGLMQIYEALGRKTTGKVAVKVHSGEPGGHFFVQPDFIEPLVKEVNGTIVECNTAYGGGRSTTEAHQRVMDEHGFTAIAPVDIMDADESMSLPILGGKHLNEVLVGSHFADYDIVINLAHFKGHMMGGFGGVLKNMAIGMASSTGKSLVHSAGTQTTGFGMGTPQDDFLESMAEAAKGIADHLDENSLYIDVMYNLSVDCDCMSNPKPPTMADIGILVSLDPVALVQACVDLIYAAPEGADMIERIESRNGIHILEHAEAIGFGTRQYELVKIE